MDKFDAGKPSFFTNMVDELVNEADFDYELKEGLAYLDKESQKRGISFYEMVFIVLHKHDTDKKAKDWNSNRSIS